MPNTTSYNFGDTILVPFPFTSQSSSKRRPGVVISSQTYHQSHADLLVMAVTSQIRPVQSSCEVLISDWQGAGLLKPSVIKPVITTLERRLVIKALGKLKTQDRQALENAIQTIFGE